MTSSLPLWGAPTAYSPEKGGYVSDARNENRDIGRDLELMTVPESAQAQVLLRDQLFDARLSQEFSDRYQEQFGTTSTEVAYRNTQRFGAYDSTTGAWGNAQLRRDQELGFAEYMGRRMLEYHIDNYAKSNPDLKEAYELKEQVTQQQVTVGPGYGLKSQYSISGNYLDVELLNPYLTSKARFDFGGTLGGPETRIALDRWLTRRLNLEAQYAVNDGVARLIARRSLTAMSLMSLTGATYLKPSGSSVREHLILAGYSLGF